MAEKLSIREIAKLSHVSVATVSRVINQKGGYSEETGQQVRDVISAYRYTPNANASGLRTNTSHSIGIMVPDITNEFFAKIIRSLDLYFLKDHYAILICDSNEDPEIENMHLDNLIKRNMDGLIYISGKNRVLSPEQIGVPVVYVDRSPKNAGVLVHSENDTGGYLAGKELLESGCRRPIFLGDERKRSPVRRRLDGFHRALKEAGIPHGEETEIWSLPDYKSGYDKIRGILTGRGLFFDGVFATNDMLALGAIHMLTELGYRVPSDVKVVGFDNVSMSKFCTPAITTVAQDTDAMAETASRELLRMIRGGEAQKKDIPIPVKLIRRDSTAAV